MASFEERVDPDRLVINTKKDGEELEQLMKKLREIQGVKIVAVDPVPWKQAFAVYLYVVDRGKVSVEELSEL